MDLSLTPKDRFDLKRKNFLEKTKKYFLYLVDEFGFEGPEQISSEQENGTIIKDDLYYKRANLEIRISNSYHPVDYGFKLNITENRTGKTEMLYSVLKENQDVEQEYLKHISESFKNKYLKK